LTKEEHQLWLALPQTKEILSKIVEWKSAIIQEIIESRTLSDNAGLTAQMTARAVGEIAGLDFILERKYLEDE